VLIVQVASREILTHLAPDRLPGGKLSIYRKDRRTKERDGERGGEEREERGEGGGGGRPRGEEGEPRNPKRHSRRSFLAVLLSGMNFFAQL